ncbi:MAG: class I SAM-dependent methyltransferase [Sneathiella sp.]
MMTLHTLQILKDHVTSQAPSGNPDLLLSAMDAFTRDTRHQLMHLGPEKGLLLDQLIEDQAPKRILELGSFFGYSAIRMARLIKGELVSLESDPFHAAIAQKLVRHAKLENQITIHHTAASHGIEHLKGQFDFILVDHYASNYYTDLRILEDRNLLAQGCLLVADNALIHAHQMADYLHYVRNSPHYSSRLVKTPCQHIDGSQDGMEITRYLTDTGVK